MASASSTPFSGRLAVRCDGNGALGAGHVGRCLPLAGAFAALGWQIVFVGRFEGLSAWLLDRAGVRARLPDPDGVCGLTVPQLDAAIVDSYDIAPVEICELANALPIATIGEANRCQARGVLLDYHLDRSEPPTGRLLAGPSFAPLDPAFAGAGRAGEEVRNILVTLGGSLAASELLTEIVSSASCVFPDATVMVGGNIARGRAMSPPRVSALPSPGTLLDVLPRIDLAITAAGFTAYELACAGVPQVAIAIAENQRRVVSALRRAALAPSLDLMGGDSLAGLPDALDALRDAKVRRCYADRGRSAFDGRGALRAATALAERFGVSVRDARRYPNNASLHSEKPDKRGRQTAADG